MFEKISLSVLPIMIFIIFSFGMIKKVPVYEEFVEGAKDGFRVSVTIIPYLVALIVAISMFRASGAMNWIVGTCGIFLHKLSIPVDIVPIMFTRSLSGSATLGLFSEIASSHGADDFVTKFYVLSVYFGSVGIKKFRYAILTGVIADITGIVLAILVARMFFLANIV